MLVSISFSIALSSPCMRSLFPKEIEFAPVLTDLHEEHLRRSKTILAVLPSSIVKLESVHVTAESRCITN